MSQNSHIAIISKAYRLPIDIQSDENLWEVLKNKESVITQIPEHRWPTEELTHIVRAEPGRSVTKVAGVISNAEKFDAGFFNISPREAIKMDPQQRLLLTLTYEALENAGTPPATLAGGNCGVYVGISSIDYGMQYLEDFPSIGLHSMTGNTLSIAANRISFAFDLHGPSIAMDTACSSSLIALHTACAAIRSGDVPCAIVAGTNLLYHPYSFVGFSQAFMLSANGQCLPFDARGDGYVRAEGAIVLFLKPLDAALAAGDPIEAVICASGVNTDGKRKSGLTIPSEEGQTELMQKVIEQSGIAPEDIDFVEMHGTGTPVGDPIEARAVSTVYAQKRATPLPISSVKANVGHLEPASGLAGLVKALLVMKNRQVPAAPFAFEPNPNIDFDALNIHYVTSEEYKLKTKGTLSFAVNSFGFGGANAHVILQSPEKFLQNKKETANSVQPPTLPPLFLSARSKKAVQDLARSYADCLESNDISKCYDILYSAATQKDFFENRVAFAEHKTPQSLIDALQEYANTEVSSAEISELCVEQNPLPVGTDENVVFVYCGNGSHWVGMAQNLLKYDTDFAQCMEELDTLMREPAGFSLCHMLQKCTEQDLENTAITQPLIFTIQVGITHLLKKQGLVPKAVMGHSVGEVVAAYVAGAYDLEQAVQVICIRSQCQALTAGLGRMAAVKISCQNLENFLKKLNVEEYVFLAGINTEEHLTLSGSEKHLEVVQQCCEENSIFFKFLPLDYAFHSPHMDSIKQELLSKLQNLAPKPTQQAVFVSSVTGNVLEGEALNAQYWWANVRKPVLFAAAMDSLMECGGRVFVEIGPHAILQRYMKDCIKKSKYNCAVFPTLLRKNDHPKCLAELCLRLSLVMSHPQLSHFFPYAGKHVLLPNYPWQFETYGFQPTSECTWQKRRVHPLLGWPLDSVDKTWENVLDPRMLHWLNHHVVGGATVFPAAGYVEIALAVGRETFGNIAYSLEFLDIIAPLIFEDAVAQVIRTTFDKGTFKILARPRLSDGAWLLYATGRIVEQKNTELPLNVPLFEFSTPATVLPFAREKIYATAEDLDLKYSETFQTIEDLQLYDEGICANIHLAQKIWQEYLLPPAALDTAFHVLLALVDKIQEAAGHPMAYLLPVKLGTIKVLCDAPISRVSTHVEHLSARSVLANCALFAADGTLVAYALQCRFKAAPLGKIHPSHVDSWKTNALFKEHTRTKAIEMQSIGGMLEDLPLNTCVHMEQRREKWLTQTLPFLEMLALIYGFESIQTLQEKNPLALKEALQSEYAQWLMGILEEQELVSHTDTGLVFYGQDVPLSHELWQEIAQTAPEALSKLLPMGRVGLHLSQALENPQLMQEMYLANCTSVVTKGLRSCDPSYTITANMVKKLVQKILAFAPVGTCVRILEVSAFSFGLAQSLYRNVAQDRFAYTFAATEDEHMQRTQNLFGKHDNFKTFLLQEEWQNMPVHEGYDIIIVQQSLHTWQNISDAIDYLKNCLLPNGLLIITECYESWHDNFIHGLNADWWRANKQSARLSPDTWQAFLLEKGFAKVAYKNEQYAEELQAGSYILLAQKSASELSTPEASDISDIAEILPEKMPIFMLGDSSAENLLKPVYETLQADAYPVSMYFNENTDSYVQSIEDFLSSFNAQENTISIVFSVGNGKGMNSISTLLDSLRQVACFIGKLQNTSLHFVLLTQGGALSFVPDKQDYNPDQAALWGMARTVMNEFPELSCTLIDLPVATGEAQVLLGKSMCSKIILEILHPDGSDEILLSEHTRQILMLDKDTAENYFVSSEHTRFRLAVAQSGKLSSLRWFEDDENPLHEHQVEVRVMATGLNFRDVMLTLGLLPDDALEKGFAGATLGLEFAGKITRIGSAVTHLNIGDSVVGFAPSCFSSHLITDATALVPMPEEWKYEEAASISSVFFTAYYALKYLANMQPGETLLIHGAAGGVGLAAIQVAKHLGVEIYATAGSDEKREFLRLQGIEHVFDSRSIDFATQIHNKTHGQGVDVVLNSLAGEAMRRSIDLLRPFGRFIELGKRDFVENTSLQLRPLRENISYFAFDADQMFAAKPALSMQVFQEIMQFFVQKVFQVLPVRTFDADQAIDAFRVMQQAQHIGKIVISMRTPPKECHKKISTPVWQGSGKWLITGGLEGFGLATAKWLAEHGVKELVLVSRRGMDSPNAQEIVASFAKNDVHVSIESCDVGQENAVYELMQKLENASSPITSIVHSAAVYADAFLSELNERSIAKVLVPKLQGAWNLHKASLSLAKQLEYFVLFSSISATVGNMGQANYVAANAGLESLALLRQSMGLSATCIAWGPISDVGYLTEHEKVKHNLEKHFGMEALSSRKALDSLIPCLMEQKAVSILANVDWQTLKHAFPYTAKRYANVFYTTKYSNQGEESSAQDMRALLADESHEDALTIVCQILIQELAKVLSLDEQQIERNATLQNLGIDSLMAVELAVNLEHRFGIRLSTMLLQDAPTIEKVGLRLLDKLLSKEVITEDGAHIENLQDFAQKHGENLSAEEIRHIEQTQENVD